MKAAERESLFQVALTTQATDLRNLLAAMLAAEMLVLCIAVSEPAPPERQTLASRFRHEMAPLPVSVRSDSMVERSEFELPVPLSKLSDDSVVL
jgi:hypothetical protein